MGEQEYTEQALTRWLNFSSGPIDNTSLNIPEAGQPLSIREMQVLTLVTNGLSNKGIAMNLGISHQNFKNHVTAILRELGVNDRTQAALHAFRRG